MRGMQFQLPLLLSQSKKAHLLCRYATEDRSRQHNDIVQMRMMEKPSGQRWEVKDGYQAAVGDRIAKEEARRDSVRLQCNA